jgi:hypothetical protein
MQLGEIRATFSRPSGFTPKRPAAAAPGAESRALVAISPDAERREPAVNYRDATFLAHLIATQGQFPQTRERRRATPHEAIAAYSAAAALLHR